MSDDNGKSVNSIPERGGAVPLGATDQQTLQRIPMGADRRTLLIRSAVIGATAGQFPHPNTMTAKLMAGNTVRFEQEYYSVGGGFIEWQGYTPPKKNPPKYLFGRMKELRRDGMMAADLIAAAYNASPRVFENAAESAPEYHLGMTSDPVAGYVQVPCVERCAFGAVKASTA